jgi:hypothetical protein
MDNKQEKKRESGLTLPHKDNLLSNVIHYTHFIRQEPGKLDALFGHIGQIVGNIFSHKGPNQQSKPEGKP